MYRDNEAAGRRRVSARSLTAVETRLRR